MKIGKITKGEKQELIQKLVREITTQYKEIKSVVVFGEEIEKLTQHSIDLLIIFDDTELSPNRAEELERELGNTTLRRGEKLGIKVIPYVYRLTDFWNYVKEGSPIILYMLKTGNTIYDVGLFSPIKRLFEMGSIYIKEQELDSLINESISRVALADILKRITFTMCLYHPTVKVTQAVLLLLGLDVPHESRIPSYVKKFFMDKIELLKKEGVDWIKELIDKGNKIVREETLLEERRELVSWSEIESMYMKCLEYVKEMSAMYYAIKNYYAKVMIINRTYKVMLKVIESALRKYGLEVPENEEKLINNFKKSFIEGGLLDPEYMDYCDKVIRLKRMVDENRTEEIKDIEYNEILKARENIRRLIYVLEYAIGESKK
mgnify:CR=1 FL=1